MSRLERTLNKIENCKVLTVTTNMMHGVLDKPGCTGSFTIEYEGKRVLITRISDSFTDRLSELERKIAMGGYTVKVDKPLRMRGDYK